MKKLSAGTGRDLRIIELSDEQIEAQKKANPFIMGQLIMRNMKDMVDIEDVKSWGVPLSTFDAFVERERQSILDTCVPTSVLLEASTDILGT